MLCRGWFTLGAVVEKDVVEVGQMMGRIKWGSLMWLRGGVELEEG